MEDKPRTDLGQAEDKKDLRRAAYRGKVQFYRINIDNNNNHCCACGWPQPQPTALN